MSVEWHLNSETVAEINTQGWDVHKSMRETSLWFRELPGTSGPVAKPMALKSGKAGSYLSTSPGLLCDIG